MTFVCSNHGVPLFWKPIRDVLQRWRLSLASLVFLTIFLTDNFGLSSSSGRSINIGKSQLSYLTGQGSFVNSKYGTQSNTSQSSPQSQCLRVNSNLSQTICSLPSSKRTPKMRQARLGFCCAYPVYNLLGNGECKDLGSVPESNCIKCFEDLLALDSEIYAMYNEFEQLMLRYDCGGNFSTHWSCSDCKAAYKAWLCSVTLPYYLNQQQKVPPCRVYCEQVEKRCPYFLPELEGQYAGEPSFLCTDSVRERQAVAAATREPCYEPCSSGPYEDDSVCPSKNHGVTRTSDSTAANSNSNSDDRNASLAREERSNSAACSLCSTQTCWAGVLAQLATVLWCSRTIAQHRCIGLT